MASSGSIFSETLKTITNTKLEELAKQQTSFSERYSALLSVAKAVSDPLERLVLLLDGAKSCLDLKTTRKNNSDGRLGHVVFGGTSNRKSALIAIWPCAVLA